jgi:hypothetical protein
LTVGAYRKYHYLPQNNWQAIKMDDIRAKLAQRLSAKGLESNETNLFIKDVLRVIASSPEMKTHIIKSKLNVLGWPNDYTDYGTIELIKACYQDG